MQAYLNHPHIVNNCIKRHVNIPTYSTTAETVYVDEYVNGLPMYQPVANNPMGLQGNFNGCGCQVPNMNTYNPQMMMQQPNEYLGNVGVESPLYKPMMYPNMNMPYNY